MVMSPSPSLTHSSTVLTECPMSMVVSQSMVM